MTLRNIAYMGLKYVVCVLLFSLSLLPSCKRSSQNLEVIRIAAVDTFSGFHSQFPTSSRNGMMMYMDEVNASGGVDGRALQLHAFDMQPVLEDINPNLQSFINDYKPMAILGSTASSRSLKIAPIIMANELVMITASSTNPKVTQVGDGIFRVCFIDSFQGDVMARFLIEQKVKTVAILNENNDYGNGLAEFFKTIFEKNGGSVVFHETYEGATVNFKSQIEKIKKLKPQVLYIPGFYADVVQIATQLAQAKLSIKLAGSDGWDSRDLLKLAGSLLDGSYFTSHFSIQNPNERFVSFKNSYNEKYKRDPDAFAALGYDAMGILVQALKKSTSPKALKTALKQTKNFEGVTGNITLDENRNPVKSAVILQIKDRKVEFVKTVDP